MTDKTKAPERPPEPSDAERAEWKDATRAYVEWLEDCEDVANSLVAAALHEAMDEVHQECWTDGQGGSTPELVEAEQATTVLAINAIQAMIDTDARAALDRLIADAVKAERARAEAAEARLAEVEKERDGALGDAGKYANEAGLLERQIRQACDALFFYGHHALGARMIHQEGDIHRQMLCDDGGERARSVLAQIKGGGRDDG